MELNILSPTFLLALTAYTVGVISPGPSNLAIMATAMTRGRSHAIALALGPVAPPSFEDDGSANFRQFYVRGLAMHLTNPKAIFVWLSIVVLATPPEASPHFAFYVVACCATIGAFVFLGYAVAFSTPIARAIYACVHRWFNSTLSLVFAFAGIRLLLTRINAAE